MTTITDWTKHFGLFDKPKYVFGVSAGGGFSMKLPAVMKIDGVVSGEQPAHPPGGQQAWMPGLVSH